MGHYTIPLYCFSLLVCTPFVVRDSQLVVELFIYFCLGQMAPNGQMATTLMLAFPPACSGRRDERSVSQVAVQPHYNSESALDDGMSS